MMQTKMNMQPVADMMTAGRQALSKNPAMHSSHLGRWKGHMAKAIGTTVIAALFGGLAFVSARKAMEEAKRHNEWSDKEKKLDEALESTLDASDPVGNY